MSCLLCASEEPIVAVDLCRKCYDSEFAFHLKEPFKVVERRCQAVEAIRKLVKVLRTEGNPGLQAAYEDCTRAIMKMDEAESSSGLDERYFFESGGFRTHQQRPVNIERLKQQYGL